MAMTILQQAVVLSGKLALHVLVPAMITTLLEAPLIARFKRARTRSVCAIAAPTFNAALMLLGQLYTSNTCDCYANLKLLLILIVIINIVGIPLSFLAVAGYRAFQGVFLNKL